MAIPIDPGKLADSIPRRMRAGLAESIEVRIARAQIAGMATATSGRAGAGQLASIVTRAVSVRLRAPDGGFVVETVAPETQWTDNLLGAYGSEFVSWRFIVTPDLAGARRLQLIISVRTVGVDGLTMETALPDQIVPVKVRANYAPALGRWAGLALAAIIGGVLARYGEGIWAIAAPVIRSFIGPG